MSITKNLTILKQKSKDFQGDSTRLEGIIKLLELNLKESKRKGIGLSAIQIEIPEKVAIIRTDKLNINLYNTRILKASDMRVSYGESCLSLPDVYVNILRPHKITIKNGDGKIYDLEGLEAVCCLHEIDHWHAILITDRVI